MMNAFEAGEGKLLMKKTTGITKVLRVLFQAACTLTFLYLLTIFAYRFAVADRGSKSSAILRFLVELHACGFLAFFAADLFRHIFTWKQNGLARVLGWILRCAVVTVCTVITVCMILIGNYRLKDTTEEVEYVMVLGLALENGRAAGDLIRRVEKAVALEKEYPEAEFIFSGGTHDDLVQTEAVIMVQHFVNHGGDIGYAREESQSQDTVQNFKNVGKMTGMSVPIAVVTSDYHMFRVAGIMRNQGWTRIRYVPAASDRLLYPENLLWEAVCVLTGIASGTYDPLFL